MVEITTKWKPFMTFSVLQKNHLADLVCCWWLVFCWVLWVPCCCRVGLGTLWQSPSKTPQFMGVVIVKQWQTIVFCQHLFFDETRFQWFYGETLWSESFFHFIQVKIIEKAWLIIIFLHFQQKLESKKNNMRHMSYTDRRFVSLFHRRFRPAMLWDNQWRGIVLDGFSDESKRDESGASARIGREVVNVGHMMSTSIPKSSWGCWFSTAFGQTQNQSFVFEENPQESRGLSQNSWIFACLFLWNFETWDAWETCLKVYHGTSDKSIKIVSSQMLVSIFLETWSSPVDTPMRSQRPCWTSPWQGWRNFSFPLPTAPQTLQRRKSLGGYQETCRLSDFGFFRSN